MWKLREGITEGLLHDGYVYKYDISLPHSSFYAIIPELKTLLPADKVGRICGYGHVGRFQIGINTASPSLCMRQTDQSPCNTNFSMYFLDFKLLSCCECCILSFSSCSLNLWRWNSQGSKVLAHKIQMLVNHSKERKNTTYNMYLLLCSVNVRTVYLFIYFLHLFWSSYNEWLLYILCLLSRCNYMILI